MGKDLKALSMCAALAPARASPGRGGQPQGMTSGTGDRSHFARDSRAAPLSNPRTELRDSVQVDSP